MQHLFSVWNDVAREIKAAKRLLLLSDYDGTLTPIVGRPELADLSEGMRHLLQALKSEPSIVVAIVSGRSVADLKARVGIRDLVYAGNHGLEIEGPGIKFISPLANEMRPVLNLISMLLKKTLDPIQGAFVENKGLTVSVHYRNVEDDTAIDDLKNAFERVVATARALRKIKTTSGKKVLEVRPATDWNKGKAVDLLVQRYGKKNNLLPVYLGDDQTDEDGFMALRRHDRGLAILVGEEAEISAAHYFLRGPSEVEQFLGMVLSMKRASA